MSKMSGEILDPEFPYKTKRKSSKSPTRIVQPIPVNSRYKRSYIISIQGLFRLVIILFQFAQWVSAAALPKNIQGQYWLPADFDQTRSACLFFSILGFLLSLIFYACYALDFSTKLDESDMPLSLIVFVLDIVWVLPTFVIAIVLAAKEGTIAVDNLILLNIVNKGAFASASFFAFCLSILYGAVAFLAYKESSNDNDNHH